MREEVYEKDLLTFRLDRLPVTQQLVNVTNLYADKNKGDDGLTALEKLATNFLG